MHVIATIEVARKDPRSEMFLVSRLLIPSAFLQMVQDKRDRLLCTESMRLRCEFMTASHSS